MKKLLLSTLLICSGLFANAQSVDSTDYKIVFDHKVQQALTTENVEQLELIIKDLQHSTDTVYYNYSPYTKVIIFPTGVATLKEEK